MERLYGSIDLHSTNNYSVVSDEKDRVLRQKRLPNNLAVVDQFFRGYQDRLCAIVVESTYNGYWLIDGLKDLQYDVKLANPSAMQQYRGLKYRNDASDAMWLNRMNRLGVLPEGYQYPLVLRSVRDLLRKRLLLVRMRTALINSFKHQYQTWKCTNLSCTEIRKMNDESIAGDFKDLYLQRSGQIILGSIQGFTRQVEEIENLVSCRLKDDDLVRRLILMPGIGKLLGWTIRLEIGDLIRFADAKHYLSYCGLVESKSMSNDRVKGSGNVKNRNKYLRWAYAEAAIASLKRHRIRNYHQRLVRKKGPIKAKGILASKLARVSFMLMRDPEMIFDETKLFV